MKLAVVVRSLTPYTVAFFDALAESVPSADTVTVITGKSGAEWINPWEGAVLRIQNAAVITSPFRLGRLGRETVWPTGDLWNQFCRLSPSHVFVQEYSPYCALAVVWAKVNRRPIFVATDIGPDYGPWYPPLSRIQKCVHRIVDFLVDGIVALTVSAQKKAKTRNRPSILSPHAVDTRIYTPRLELKTAKLTLRVLHVGNLIERKGIDLLIRGFAHALDYCEDLELRIIGSGDATVYYDLARELQISSQVKILDFMDRSSLIREYQEADIFCLATRADTYAVVVHEAASCGLPLVVSKEAGAADVLVEEGRNGFVINPENISELSRALQCLANSTEMRAQYSAASREIAQRWDCVSNARRVLNWLRTPL